MIGSVPDPDLEMRENPMRPLARCLIPGKVPAPASPIKVASSRGEISGEVEDELVCAGRVCVNVAIVGRHYGHVGRNRAINGIQR